MTQPKSVLFVCLGNIVRSPLAEHLFRKYVQELPELQTTMIASAGTSSWHLGESPDSRMRSTAAKHGLKYDGSARRVTPDDFKTFDLIIAMDESNVANLRSMTNDPVELGKLHLLREFD